MKKVYFLLFFRLSFFDLSLSHTHTHKQLTSSRLIFGDIFKARPFVVLNVSETAFCDLRLKEYSCVT
jgi:hypothetical protein